MIRIAIKNLFVKSVTEEVTVSINAVNWTNLITLLSRAASLSNSIYFILKA